MTVIAWDGKTLAADKQATLFSMKVTTTKIRRIKRRDVVNEVLAWSGDQDSGQAMAAWYEAGANPTLFHECQQNNEAWTRLIVADRYGAKYYERSPIGVKVEDAFAAWGTGSDFAVMAMHLGKSAREAVELTCLFATGCGNGVDSFDLT